MFCNKCGNEIKDGLVKVYTAKTSFAPSYTITVKSSVCDNGLYVCLKDGKITYNENIDYVKESI